MTTTIEKVFRSPYSVPNGLQVTDDGLWIVDQITDRVALVEIAADADYTVPKLIRDIPSESSNTSGMAYGGDALWLAANGPGERWRPIRDTDAKPGAGEIFKVHPATGETLARYPVPDGGGTHGVEYDNYDEGHLWVQTLKKPGDTQGADFRLGCPTHAAVALRQRTRHRSRGRWALGNSHVRPGYRQTRSGGWHYLR